MDANDDKLFDSNRNNVTNTNQDTFYQQSNNSYQKTAVTKLHSTSFESNERAWDSYSITQDLSFCENQNVLTLNESNHNGNTLPHNVTHVSTQPQPFYNDRSDAHIHPADRSQFNQFQPQANPQYYDQAQNNSFNQWNHGDMNLHTYNQTSAVEMSDTRSVQSEYSRSYNHAIYKEGFYGIQQWDPQTMNTVGNYHIQPSMSPIVPLGVNYPINNTASSTTPSNPISNTFPNYSQTTNNPNFMAPAVPSQINVMNSLVEDFNKWMISYKVWMENHMRDQERMSTKRSHRNKSRRRHSKEYLQSFDDSIKTNYQVNSSIRESQPPQYKKVSKNHKKRREHPYFEYQRCIATINNVDGSIVVVCNQYFYNDYLKHYIYTYYNILEQSVGCYNINNTISYPGPLSKTISSSNKSLLKFISNKIELIKFSGSNKSSFERILLWKLMYNLVNNKGVIDYMELTELFMSKEDFNRQISRYSHTFLLNNEKNGLNVFNDSFYSNSSTQDHLKNLVEVFMNQKLWSLAFSTVSNNESLHQFVLTRFVNDLGVLNPMTTIVCFLNGIRIPILSAETEDFKANYSYHLVAVLANAHSNTKFAKLIFESFAERFYSLGMVLLTHFCFLIADVVPNVSDDIDKFSLIGLEPLAFATEKFGDQLYEESVILTEIYEYTRQLVDDNFVLVSLIPLKFTLANILFERGLMENAYHYCEVIAKFLIHHPTLFSKKFLYDVFKFSQILYLYLSSNLVISEHRSDWLDILSQIVRSITHKTSPSMITTNVTSFNTMNSCVNTGENSTKESMAESDCYSKETEAHHTSANDRILPTNTNSTVVSSIRNSHTSADNHVSMANHSINVLNTPTVTSALPREKISEHSPQDRDDTPSVVFFNASDHKSINILPPAPPVSVTNSEMSLTAQPLSIKMFSQESRKDDNLPNSTSDVKNCTSQAGISQHLTKSEESTATTPTNQNPGMFGGLFSKFLPTKNKVFLPEDNDPSHIYDEKTQKWVDIKKDPNDIDKDYSEAPPMIPLSRKNMMESISPSDKIPVPSTTSSSRERLKNRYVPPNL